MDTAITERLLEGSALWWELPGVLSSAECDALMARIDAAGPTAAPVSTERGPVHLPNVRNNERVMFDDVALASLLYERVKKTLPSRIAGRVACGANERLRCYRYKPGQRFAKHYDGKFVRHEHERSELTLIVYLNDDFVGGTTNFLDLDITVTPRRGTALLFFHRLLHEGAMVTEGAKYVLRSDVMYRSP